MNNYDEFEMIDVPSGDSFDRMSRADALAELEMNRELLRQKRKSLEDKDGGEDIHAMQSILALEEAIAELEKALGIAEFDEEPSKTMGKRIDPKSQQMIANDEDARELWKKTAKEDEALAEVLMEDSDYFKRYLRKALWDAAPVVGEEEEEDNKINKFDEESSLTSEFLTEVSDKIAELSQHSGSELKIQKLALLAKEYIIQEDLDISVALKEYPLIRGVLEKIIEERNFDGEFAEIEYVEPSEPDPIESRKRLKEHDELLNSQKKKKQIESILSRIAVALKDKKLSPEKKSELKEKKNQLEGMMGDLVKFEEKPQNKLSKNTKEHIKDSIDGLKLALKSWLSDSSLSDVKKAVDEVDKHGLTPIELVRHIPLMKSLFKIKHGYFSEFAERYPTQKMNPSPRLKSKLSKDQIVELNYDLNVLKDAITNWRKDMGVKIALQTLLNTGMKLDNILKYVPDLKSFLGINKLFGFDQSFEESPIELKSPYNFPYKLPSDSEPDRVWDEFRKWIYINPQLQGMSREEIKPIFLKWKSENVETSAPKKQQNIKSQKPKSIEYETPDDYESGKKGKYALESSVENEYIDEWDKIPEFKSKNR